MGFNLAALLVLGAGTALGQYPQAQYPQAQYPQARPNYPPPGGPQQPPPPSASIPGSGGQVMYFCKPADASVPLSGSGAGVVATSGTADLPIPPSTPTQLPPVLPSIPNAGGAALELPIPPPQFIQNGTPPTQPYSGGNTNYTLPQPASQPYVPPQPASQPYVPPNQTGAADRFTPVQPRDSFGPVNQYSPSTQPNAPPGNLPPDRKLMNPPDPRTLSPEYRTELPPREQIFRMRDPRELEKWVLDETRSSLNIKTEDTSLRFPDEEVIGGGLKYQAKTGQYNAQQITYQNLFVVHRRLLFEEKNAERYGWDFGILQPLVSSAYFYKDVLLLPYTLVSGCTEGFWDSSSGKCLPGSPTPYLLYPPGLSLTGGAFEGAVVVGLAAFIP